METTCGQISQYQMVTNLKLKEMMQKYCSLVWFSGCSGPVEVDGREPRLIINITSRVRGKVSISIYNILCKGGLKDLK